MKKSYKTITIFSLLFLIIFILLFTFSNLSNKKVDMFVKNLMINSSRNDIESQNELIVINGDKNNSSDVFVVVPCLGVDFKSYVVLGDELAKSEFDVFVVKHLMNIFDYSKYSMNRLELCNKNEHKIIYILHGSDNDSVIEYINNHKENTKALIFLDGYNDKVDKSINVMQIASDENLCQDEIKCNVLDDATFEGYANYISPFKPNNTWPRQQKGTIKLILEYVGGVYEK